MRGAFVVQLGPETRPKEGTFEGRVEEVDTGVELRFRSREALFEFIEARFDVAMAATGKARARSSENIPPEKEVLS